MVVVVMGAAASKGAAVIAAETFVFWVPVMKMCVGLKTMLLILVMKTIAIMTMMTLKLMICWRASLAGANACIIAS